MSLLERMILGVFVSFVVAVASIQAYKAGVKSAEASWQRRMMICEKRLERFENEFVFRHAQKVSQITGRDLYQVLTGLKGKNKS